MVKKFPLTWVVVADSARMRTFKWAGPREDLVEVLDLVNPEGRMRNSELASDGAGMSLPAKGNRSVHPMQPRHSPHEDAANSFAREIATTLSRSLNDHEFQHLILVAPPTFLGLLRPHLEGPVRHCIKATVNRDLTTAPARDIVTRLPNPWIK